MPLAIERHFFSGATSSVRVAFRTQSNIYDGDFFSKIVYFRKTAPLQIFESVVNTPLRIVESTEKMGTSTGNGLSIYKA